MHKEQSKAFTLIELLIVIAIIAIIAAILFPVFATAREKARQSACTSNLKQLGLAFMQYAQDYDEYMPCGRATGGQGWAGEIYPYVKNVLVYKCPDDQTTDNVGSDLYFLACTYSYNSNVDVMPNTLSLNQFGAPSNTVLLCEVVGGHTIRTGWTTSATGIDPNDNQSSSNYGAYWSRPNSASAYATGNMGGYNYGSYTASPYHSTGSNFLACDGHVKWLVGSSVSVWNPAATPNSPQTGNGTWCAAGTSNMSDASGRHFALTYSPV